MPNEEKKKQEIRREPEKMPVRKKHNWANLIVSGLGVFFFVLAAYMIYKQMSKYTYEEIETAILDVPIKGYFCALLFVFLSYMVLALYDLLALHYIGKRSFLFRWMLAGATGFAVSNNAGHAFISGTAIRYHLYRRWGFTIPDIIKMVTFSSFTYLLGCFFLLIIGYSLTPSGAIGNVPPNLTLGLVIISVISLAAYLTAAILIKKPLIYRSLSLYFPSLKQALAQMIIGSSDVILASLVLYSVVYTKIDTPFGIFLGVFLIAQTLGTFSQVPGGVGVFESIFFFVMADSAEKEIPLIAGLIVYRMLYYFLPLILSACAIFIYETRFRYGKRKILRNRGKKQPEPNETQERK